MTGWLDRQPTWARDLGLMVLSALLTWAGTNLVPVLSNAGGLWTSLAAPLVVLLVAALTRWTQAYGRGSGRHRGTDEGLTDTWLVLLVMVLLAAIPLAIYIAVTTLHPGGTL